MNPGCILHDYALLESIVVLFCLPSAVVHRVMFTLTHPLEFVLYPRRSSSSTELLTLLNAHLVLVLRYLKKVSTSSAQLYEVSLVVELLNTMYSF